MLSFSISFFFQAEDGIRDGHVTGVQTCALPISFGGGRLGSGQRLAVGSCGHAVVFACRDRIDRLDVDDRAVLRRRGLGGARAACRSLSVGGDRKSTRLNSSHVAISYAVFCLKKK